MARSANFLLLTGLYFLVSMLLSTSVRGDNENTMGVRPSYIHAQKVEGRDAMAFVQQHGDEALETNKNEMGLKPDSEELLKSDDSASEVSQHVGYTQAVRKMQMHRQSKVAVCPPSQLNGLYNLLIPCAQAVMDTSVTPSDACCDGAKAVTDNCFCYLESLIPGNAYGITLENALRVAKYCGRKIVQC
ncbi:hypothetical protein Mapa_012520 [Marchantia paleacea]|nr:hypothetical protein Mapa_012520 [Marchantia paleacea]